MTTLTQSSLWQRLSSHRTEISRCHLRDLFREDPRRSERFSLERAGLFLDYSKQRITDGTLDLLLQLAVERGVEKRREAMFSGAHINATEDRAVLHTALRDRSGAPLMVDGVDVAAEVAGELLRMATFAQAVRNRRILGAGGSPIRDIVNIGIGGSDLGPQAVCNALEAYAGNGPTLHFLSNPDSSAVHRILSRLDPASTLFIVSSKTFTTQESLANFATARAWMGEELGGDGEAMAQFVAVTAHPEAAVALGFAAERVFRFWDWVGGRYSLWSAIGLPIMLAVGPDRFEALLDGAWHMDQHFRREELRHNMPVLLALVGIWNHNFLGARSHLVVPYDTRLRSLPAYLQQLDMESNGKRVDGDGEAVDYDTGPIVWGDLGINGQHAFFQLVHQGTHLVPVDFVGVVASPDAMPEHQRIVHANMLAQAEALMTGRGYEETRHELASRMPADVAASLARHRTFPGNVPSNTLLLPQLTPATLGALIALYEHKVFVQGAIWGINSYDQWGVELGKQLGKVIYDELCGLPPCTDHDASTAALIQRVRSGLSAA